MDGDTAPLTAEEEALVRSWHVDDAGHRARKPQCLTCALIATIDHERELRAEAVRFFAERVRALSDAATPGPWHATTIGTASQWDAARRVAEAVLAVRVPDRPDIQFTDLSWVRTDGEDWLNIAAVGNGPTSPENAKFIAAAVNLIREALQAAETTDDR